MTLPIARYLDHAVLKPEMTSDEARAAIELGVRYKVRTVCVRPCDIELAREIVDSTDTLVSCVLDFPHGCGLPEVKAEQARIYCQKGVAEIDMVANYGWIRSGRWQDVEADVVAVTKVAREYNVLVKVIFETSQLTLEEIAEMTRVCIAANADFVKTSTGFNGAGATEDGVRVMLETAQGRIAVKPSGGIRDYARATMFVQMGCERLGVNYSSTPDICAGEKSTDLAGTKEGNNDSY